LDRIYKIEQDEQDKSPFILKIMLILSNKTSTSLRPRVHFDQQRLRVALTTNC